MERISSVFYYVGSKLKYIWDILDYIKYTIKIYFTCFYFVNLFSVARKLIELYMWLQSESHFGCVHIQRETEEKEKEEYILLFDIYICIDIEDISANIFFVKYQVVNILGFVAVWPLFSSTTVAKM